MTAQGAYCPGPLLRVRPGRPEHPLILVIQRRSSGDSERLQTWPPIQTRVFGESLRLTVREVSCGSILPFKLANVQKRSSSFVSVSVCAALKRKNTITAAQRDLPT